VRDGVVFHPGINGFLGRSSWIPGSYASIFPKALNSFLRPFKNKGFEVERMTKIGLYAFVNSTTPQSKKSVRD
jgi:hypothetical protein